MEKLKIKVIAVLGWAFKANTNDSRESAAIYILTNELLEAGAIVKYMIPMVKEDKIRTDLKILWESLSLSYEEIKKKWIK